MGNFVLKNGKTVVCRKLRAGDEEALARFDAELSPLSRSRFLPHAYDRPTLARVVARVEQGHDLAYVALDGERVIAYFFLWWYDTPFPVLGIGILDQYHRQGLGRQIIKLLIAEARRAGCDAIELTTVLDNEPAYELYTGMGFKCLGQVDNIAGDGRVVREWHMYYPLKPGIVPPPREHCSPV